ncbi:MAG: cytochrome b N-terminal domain-containing protein [Acidobacteria bacterium]|nr:cytochrome b N-terminal domain-containing protein [Acidobacteriota bacterium]
MGLIFLEKINDFLQWIDERTEIKSVLEKITKEPISGGTSWAYVLGSGLLFALILQIITGVLLLLYYVPSSDAAHTSVAYIQKEVPFGNLIRGIHYHGTNLIVILTVLHTLRTFFWGAYKNKRELVWITGLLLLFIVLGFTFSGYLLPWDNNAYFGTGVRVGIMSSIPIIGEATSAIVLGGSTISTLTLSRFFTLHVGALPAILFLFIAIHLFLVFKAKHSGDYKPTTITEDFYPKQFFKNSCFALLIFVILASLSYISPALLELEANPSDSNYIARPEWYFLFIFQLLKYFPGNLGLIPKVILPGLFFTICFLLPFLDKSAERNPLKRPYAILAIVFLSLGALLMASIAVWEDRSNKEVKAQLERQASEANVFLKSPFTPKNIGKAITPKVEEKAPATPSIYQAKCSACHGETAQGQVGPNLHNLSLKEKRTRDDIVKLLKDPNSYGLSPAMPAFDDISEKERQELADWILSLK